MELCQLNALWCPEAQHTCTFVWPSQTLPRALHPQKFKQCLRTQMSVPTLLSWWFRNGRPLIYFRFFRLPSRLRTLQFEGSRMRFDLKPSISWPAAIWNGASSILYGMNANQSHEDLLHFLNNHQWNTGLHLLGSEMQPEIKLNISYFIQLSAPAGL